MVSVSPFVEEAITSMITGLFAAEISSSVENPPSISGITSCPFTLRVASGEAVPATVACCASVIRLTWGCQPQDQGLGLGLDIAD